MSVVPVCVPPSALVKLLPSLIPVAQYAPFIGFVLTFTVKDYFKNHDESMFYDGSNLVVRLGFDTRKETATAITQLQSMHLEQRQSPLYGKLGLEDWGTAVQEWSQEDLGLFIFMGDYVPEMTESPEWNLSEHSFSHGETSILHEATDPVARRLVKFQRIGMRSIFGCEQCHIISRRLCGAEASLSKYLADDNNLLAMIRPLHQAFDGLQTPDNIPVLLLEYISTAEMLTV